MQLRPERGYIWWFIANWKSQYYCRQCDFLRLTVASLSLHSFWVSDMDESMSKQTVDLAALLWRVDYRRRAAVSLHGSPSRVRSTLHLAHILPEPRNPSFSRSADSSYQTPMIRTCVGTEASRRLLVSYRKNRHVGSDPAPGPKQPRLA